VGANSMRLLALSRRKFSAWRRHADPDDVLGIVNIQGDEAAVRAIFKAPTNPTP
jgi:hypothetical protein